MHPMTDWRKRACTLGRCNVKPQGNSISGEELGSGGLGASGDTEESQVAGYLELGWRSHTWRLGPGTFLVLRGR